MDRKGSALVAIPATAAGFQAKCCRSRNIIAAREVGIDEQSRPELADLRSLSCAGAFFDLNLVNKISKLSNEVAITKTRFVLLQFEHQSTLFRPVHGPILGTGG